jgi:hypothetical protein
VDPALAEEHQRRKKRMDQNREHKSAFSKGAWNCQTVAMGGLGWNPALADDDGETEASESKVQRQLDVVWTTLKMSPKHKMDMAIKCVGR